MSSPPHDSLTDADRALLERLAEGKRDKHIARELGVNPATVNMRVKRIRKILGAENRPHAVALYLAPEKYRKP